MGKRKMHPKSSIAVVLAALTGLLAAHPSRHADFHLARRMHLSDIEHVFKPRDSSFLISGPPPAVTSPDATVSTADVNQTPDTAPVAAVPAEAAPSSPPAAANPANDAAYIPFCSGVSKRATIGEIFYVGNTGTVWGCNMMVIDPGAASLYSYTAEFVTTGETYSCACFNKIGPDGKLDGFWHTAVPFTVGSGQSTWLAFDKNTQGGCACGPGSGSPPKTPSGQWAGTWLEFDWGDDANGGNSGSDVSVLVSGANNMPYYGMQLTANGNLCSWVKSNGEHMDAYMPGMEAANGVGCNGYFTGSLSVVMGD